MLLMEPWLTDVESTMLPRPWVKWAYEPARAEDIPAVFMRAVATALQPPSGPVFLSFPLGDWEVPCQGQAVAFADALGAPVWAAPASERSPFPENHPLYSGGLPFAMQPLSKKLDGHDVALVVGAPVFRYYPYVPGPYLPAGLRLLHISDDPAETARAPVGDSLLGDAVLSLEGLKQLLGDCKPKATRARE